MSNMNSNRKAKDLSKQPIVVMERMDLDIVTKLMPAASLKLHQEDSDEGEPLQKTVVKHSNKSSSVDKFSVLKNSSDAESCKVKYASCSDKKSKLKKKQKRTVQETVKNVERAMVLVNQSEAKWKEDVLKYVRLINHSDFKILKYSNCMNRLLPVKLVQFLKCIECIIRNEGMLSSLLNKMYKNNAKSAFETIEAIAHCCLTSLYILTSPEMPKRIYVEHVINSVVYFIGFYLRNIIFPMFDNTHSKINKVMRIAGLEEKKRSFYEKGKTLLKLFAEFMNNFNVIETSITSIASFAISSLSINNITELQLLNMKLLINIFTNSEKDLTPLLEMILKSLLQLPTEKRQMLNYKLSSGKHMNIFSVLITQLIQSVLTLPKKFYKNESSFNFKEADKIISNKYEQAKILTGKYLTIFLNECSKRLDELNSKIIFENFIYDLLTLFHKPEWPATELILIALKIILINKFCNKDLDMHVRIMSLEFLSIILTQLKMHNRSLQNERSRIDDLIEKIHPEGKSYFKNEKNEIQFLQQILLDYLALNSRISEFDSARHFYIVKWYINVIQEDHLKNKTKNQTKGSKSRQIKKENDKNIRTNLLNKLQPVMENPARIIDEHIKHKDASLIVKHLTFGNVLLDFDQHLKLIIMLLKESIVTARIKALKCLRMVIGTDTLLLNKHEVQRVLMCVLLDPSNCVRESAVELIGKFIKKDPQLIDNYYNELSSRMLDISVAVRKHIIRIFNGIYINFTNFTKKTETCINMMRRINDEESVQKLVIEVFSNMWFTPCNNKSVLSRKISNIIDVVKNCDNINLEFFRKLLAAMFRSKLNKKNSILACKEIICYLIENLHKQSADLFTSSIILRILTQAEPIVMVEHYRMLQLHLCSDYDDKVISNIIKIFEKIVPEIPKSEQMFLDELEQELIKLIMKHNYLGVIISSVSCLKSIISITGNFDFIRKCFETCYDYLVQVKSYILQNEFNSSLYKIYFKRAVFVVGLLFRHFNFDDPEVIGELSQCTKDEVFQLFLFFLEQNEDIQLNVTKAIGWLSLRYHEFLLNEALKQFYRHVLVSEDVSLAMKLSVLHNIEIFINVVMESSSEITEDSSEIFSSTVQYYINDLLQSYLHPNIQVRQVVSKIVQLILQHGVAHPPQMVPYLICMSTDVDNVISKMSDKELLTLNQTYVGFIHSKSLLGVKLSYQLQIKLHKTETVRGFKNNASDDEYPLALNGFLYSLLQTIKPQRRSFILNILQHFQEEMAPSSLSFLVYLADNLAYFSYTTMDEVLFLIYHIDRIISYAGEDILETFEKNLKESEILLDENANEENEETLLKRVPNDISSLWLCITSAQGFLLLLLLKQYLKLTYRITDNKIHQYSPMESTKLYDKPLNRYKKSRFEPKQVIENLHKKPLLLHSSDEERKDLIQQYLHFKQLVHHIDARNLDEENEKTDNYKVSNTSQSLTLEQNKSKSRNSSKNVKASRRKRKRRRLTFSKNDSYDTEDTDSE